MEGLVKITELSEKFAISSRTLRYYEQVGLMQSIRLPLEKYRFYDEENIARLQQILVLRKMQLPIKDIITIYESHDMTVLVQSFVSQINAIHQEIEALTELKSLVNDFLQAMMENGITHISALPLLYEKMEAQLCSTEEKQPITLERLDNVYEKVTKPLDINIVTLAPMRVLSSRRKDTGISDVDGFWNWLAKNQIPYGTPGSHSLFEYQDDFADTVFIQKIEPSSAMDSPYSDYEFEGGLFAACTTYLDNDIGELHQNMIRSFDDNVYFEVDYNHGGSLRHDSLVEAVISPDRQREKINLYLAVKKRKLEATNHLETLSPDMISIAEIDAANPVLEEYKLDLHKITPIYDPHYKVLDSGEAEFICWISARMLSTNVAVKIPFRVDIEFLTESASERYGYGADKGSLWFSHGNHNYTINAQNHADEKLSKHAIAFDQPGIGNRVVLPNVGNIRYDEYNQLSWIIGEKHFAVMINGELRYCGIDFPYMNTDLHLQKPESIMIGSNGQAKKLFRSIKISQLKVTPKINVKKGELTMAVKQSNNKLQNLHQMVTLHYGENYWFNGCGKYVMECIGEPDYDDWFFAGLTGDNFAQVYTFNHFRGDGATDYILSENGKYEFIEDIFSTCGYASSFIPMKQLVNNREMYVQTLISYIDKGIPVIFNDLGNNPNERHGWSVYVGYEDYGKTLLYLGGDAVEPDRISIEDALPDGYKPDLEGCTGWIFVGEKNRFIVIEYSP
jgi:DNA-binding transcriptional MerR regulator